MYINVHQDKECSVCGAVNQTETVTRNYTFSTYGTFLRCLRCGHEKELYSIATNSAGGPVNYKIEPTDNKEVF